MSVKKILEVIFIRIPELMSGIALSIMITLSVVNAFCRYCLRFTIAGADEYIAIMFAWLVFTGGAVAYRHGMHYGIDLLVNKLKKTPRRILDVIVRSITVILLITLAYLSYVLFINVGPKILTATRISYRWFDASMIYGFGLMILYSIEFLVKDINSLIDHTGRKEAKG